jgi:tape measure domain-containing protein
MATLRIETEVDRSGEIKVRKLREEVGRLSKAELDNPAASRRMSAGLGSLATRVAGVTAAFYAAKEGIGGYISAADEMKLVESRLSLVTASASELEDVQAKLYATSQESRQSFAETSDLYARMARATKDLGTSQEDLLTVTDAINKSLIVSGASTAEAQSAITQLGQGLASGVLRGEEFNSIMENGNRIALAMADSLGVNLGQLRAMAGEGKLTAEVVIGALKDQADAVDSEFDKMGKTVGQASTQGANSIKRMIAEIDQILGATDSAADAITTMAKSIDEIDFTAPETIATVDFIRATISRTVDLFNVLYETVENTGQNVVSGIAAFTYGTLAPILEMMRITTEGLNSIGLSSDETLEQVLRSEIAVKDAAAQAAKDIAENNNEMLDALKKFSPTIEERIEGYRKERAAIKDVTEEVKKRNKVMNGFVVDVDKVAKAEEALWKHSQKMHADWLRDTLDASNTAMNHWQEYYESIGNMSAAWAIEETRLREEWADFPELENFIKMREKLFKEQHAQPGAPSALQAEIDSLKNHYDQIAYMEEDSAQHRIDIVRQAMEEKLIAIKEGNALIEQIEAEHQNNLTDLTEWGLTSRKDFDQMSYEDRGLMFSSFLEGMTREAAQQNEAAFRVNQAAAIANATISTSLGVSKALEWGYPMGPIFAGLIAAKGGLQIATIAKQQYRGYETGGVVPGGEQIIRINERGQEAVLNAQATRAIGKEGVDALNSGKGLAQAPVVNLKTVNVLDPAMVGDYLDSSDSDTVFVNKISRNAEQIRSALNA